MTVIWSKIDILATALYCESYDWPNRVLLLTRLLISLSSSFNGDDKSRLFPCSFGREEAHSLFWLRNRSEWVWLREELFKHTDASISASRPFKFRTSFCSLGVLQVSYLPKLFDKKVPWTSFREGLLCRAIEPLDWIHLLGYPLRAGRIEPCWCRMHTYHL